MWRKILVVILTFVLIFTSISVAETSRKEICDTNKSNHIFYFVHITDTHIINKIFDRNEKSRNRLVTVLEQISSFESKPSFLAITGDLVEWGSGFTGSLNYKTLTNCFYEENNHLYADSDCSIPVYFTPGNHDYYFSWNLNNYYKYLKEERHYIINFEDLTLFFMDSGPHLISKPRNIFDVYSRGLSDQDLEWLEGKLSNCNSKFKVVLMHHPAVNIRKENGDMIDVLYNNKEDFIELCEKKNVEVVLAGHTHRPIVLDSNENIYTDLPINCSLYPTLFVQSDDNKQGVNYRNVSISESDIWIEASVNLN